MRVQVRAQSASSRIRVATTGLLRRNACYHACLYFGNACIYSVPGLTCNWRTLMAKAKKKAKKKAAKKK
jgi:hypothetical protein